MVILLINMDLLVIIHLKMEVKVMDLLTKENKIFIANNFMPMETKIWNKLANVFI